MSKLDLAGLGIASILACVSCNKTTHQATAAPPPTAEGGERPAADSTPAPDASPETPAQGEVEHQDQPASAPASKGQKLVQDPKRFGAVPDQAKQAIAAAYDAALEQDYDALRSIMIEDPIWSIDGKTTGTPAQATAAWKGNPWPAKKLIMAIEGGCALRSKRLVCPIKNDMGADYEAVFKEKDGSWKLSKLTLGG